MAAGVQLHYELTGTGWSECRLEIGDVHRELTACYLSDALGDLAGAIEDVLRGRASTRGLFSSRSPANIGGASWRLGITGCKRR